MKHRMLEFLVEEMGFNTFAMETNGPEANLINDFIHTGKGDCLYSSAFSFGFYKSTTTPEFPAAEKVYKQSQRAG